MEEVGIALSQMLLRSLWYDLTLPTFLLGPSRLSIILNVEAVEIIIRSSHMYTDYDLVTVLMVGAWRAVGLLIPSGGEVVLSHDTICVQCYKSVMIFKKKCVVVTYSRLRGREILDTFDNRHHIWNLE